VNNDDFLSAIRGRPADRTTRLAYSDWLDERGDSRAELIRVCEAMRRVPVFADDYWRLKGRRNELLPACPLDWLAATGYDGSDYDPIFRDGVPDGWRERWRLIREFTERWHGVDVPDVGGQRAAVREAEDRLGLALPPSVQEYVAFSHDLCVFGTPEHDPQRHVAMLFHAAHYELNHADPHLAIGLVYYTLSGSVLGIYRDDLIYPDPPTSNFKVGERAYDEFDVDYDESGIPQQRLAVPRYCAPSLSVSVLSGLTSEMPVAGWLSRNIADRQAEFFGPLPVDFPVHAAFDDYRIYETREMIVLVAGGRPGEYGGPPRQILTALVRRPIPVESIPPYLFGTDDRETMSSGWLGPEWYRRQMAEQYSQPGARQPPRWTSPLE
jgi:uncharacterized protein (TIGR02996 family)